MSTCKFFLMQILFKGPEHGYTLLEKMRTNTEGRCNASYGTIYPILKKLAEEGLASIKYDNIGNRKRKVYKLTARGKNAYVQALKAWEDILPYLNKSIKEDLRKKPLHKS